MADHSEHKAATVEQEIEQSSSEEKESKQQANHTAEQLNGDTQQTTQEPAEAVQDHQPSQSQEQTKEDGKTTEGAVLEKARTQSQDVPANESPQAIQEPADSSQIEVHQDIGSVEEQPTKADSTNQQQLIAEQPSKAEQPEQKLQSQFEGASLEQPTASSPVQVQSGEAKDNQPKPPEPQGEHQTPVPTIIEATSKLEEAQPTTDAAADEDFDEFREAEVVEESPAVKYLASLPDYSFMFANQLL